MDAGCTRLNLHDFVTQRVEHDSWALVCRGQRLGTTAAGYLVQRLVRVVVGKEVGNQVGIRAGCTVAFESACIVVDGFVADGFGDVGRWFDRNYSVGSCCLRRGCLRRESHAAGSERVGSQSQNVSCCFAGLCFAGLCLVGGKIGPAGPRQSRTIWNARVGILANEGTNLTCRTGNRYASVAFVHCWLVVEGSRFAGLDRCWTVAEAGIRRDQQLAIGVMVW